VLNGDIANDDGSLAIFYERNFISSVKPISWPLTRRIARGPGLSKTLSAALTIRSTSRQLDRHGLWSVYSDSYLLETRGEAKEAEPFLDAFVTAENFTPLRKAPKDCLPRSLALYRFLLGCGFPVQQLIGVLPRPFSAHAWVELDGTALLEARPPHHRVIARMSPAS
jgi:hypothetical protein